MTKRDKIIRYLIYIAAFLILMIFPVERSCASIRAYLNYAFFNSPSEGPYIETYLAVDGNSVVFLPAEDGSTQALINVTMIFRQDSNIVAFDKYSLTSTRNAAGQASDESFGIIDMQRYFLPAGDYEFEIIMDDENNSDEPFNAKQLIQVGFDKKNVCISGIQLVDSISETVSPSILTKCGYDLYPKVVNYYPPDDQKLKMYTEIYHLEEVLGKEEKFLITAQIKSFESDFILEDYAAYKRADTKAVYPFFQEFDISGLPSGNFILTIEVRDRNNTPRAVNALFFQRDNPEADMRMENMGIFDISNTFVSKMIHEDSLTEHIQSLAPRATHSEKQFIWKGIKMADLEKKQRFFYYFWVKRSPSDPESAWLEYYDMVLTVNQRFKTQVDKGYETDRGRVYLQYGPPNAVSERYNEPSTYPYEIWHFYKLGFNQSDKRFVFYTHDITTNKFELLHSTAIGELHNPRWEIVLNSRWYDPYGVDNMGVPEIWGGRARDFYIDPR